jgi:prepilin-type N-terminal cleavage/methylation domain-containing protein
MRKGFTLVEILVAVIILAVGILAVSQMTVMGMRVNTVVNQRMYARVVLARQFEWLQNLPDADSLLTDYDTDSTDLDEIDSADADFVEVVVDTTARYRYLTLWNVANNLPESGVKTVRIHVLWGPVNRHRISSDLIKRL